MLEAVRLLPRQARNLDMESGRNKPNALGWKCQDATFDILYAFSKIELWPVKIRKTDPYPCSHVAMRVARATYTRSRFPRHLDSLNCLGPIL